MNLEEVQNKAVETYNRNLEFLKRNNDTLFKKIKLFEEAIELNYTKERYSLEYKENYFDVYDNQNKTWLYGTNAETYSSNIVKDVNFNTFKNTFKTFYEFNFEDKAVENAKRASILSQTIFGVAPISAYVQKQLDEKQEMKDIFKYFIFGVGLGLHIPKIHEKIKAKVYLVIEPSLELFRLSLFVTDYTSIKGAKTHFAVALSEPEFKELVYMLSEQTFIYDYYIKFFKFSNSCDMYINTIQNYLVSQKHILYAFNRQLESLKRTYEYTHANYKFMDISIRVNKSFLKKPVLILAMGPSLQTKINFVKENQDKFIIIAIYATLPILEENYIKPDFIVQYDQQDEIVMSTLTKVKDKTFFNESLCLFASHLDKKLMESFQKENIYVYNALYESREGFSKLTAPSVGEIAYALSLLFGAKQVYLLGLDLALGDDGQSHSGDHEGSKAFNETEERSNENFNFRKNILKIKGNFRESVDTLPIFKSSISQMNYFTKEHKLEIGKVYNLSDGAYFDQTIPMEVSNLENHKLENFDKKTEIKEIKKNLEKISKNENDDNDISFNNEKEKDALILLDSVDKFFNKTKYSNTLVLKNAIFELFDDLIYKQCKCNDLQDILLNFYKYTLPSVFHLYNMRKLDNPKRHMKQLNKVLFLQTKKIFEEYLEVFKK